MLLVLLQSQQILHSMPVQQSFAEPPARGVWCPGCWSMLPGADVTHPRDVPMLLGPPAEQLHRAVFLSRAVLPQVSAALAC